MQQQTVTTVKVDSAKQFWKHAHESLSMQIVQFPERHKVLKGKMYHMCACTREQNSEEELDNFLIECYRKRAREANSKTGTQYTVHSTHKQSLAFGVCDSAVHLVSKVASRLQPHYKVQTWLFSGPCLLTHPIPTAKCFVFIFTNFLV